MSRAFTALVCTSLFLLATRAWPADRAAEKPPALPSVTVSVFNDAHVPEPVLLRAQQVAARIFQEGGVKVTWIDCWSGKLAPAEKALCQQPQLSLRVVPRASGMMEDAFGAAFLDADGNGRYSDVFFDRIEKLQRSEPGTVDLADLLGCVAAHEVGHLLGVRLHSRFGIMRARWEQGELQSAAMGTLMFTADQSQLMRTHLANPAPAAEAMAVLGPQ